MSRDVDSRDVNRNKAAVRKRLRDFSFVFTAPSLAFLRQVLLPVHSYSTMSRLNACKSGAQIWLSLVIVQLGTKHGELTFIFASTE